MKSRRRAPRAAPPPRPERARAPVPRSTRRRRTILLALLGLAATALALRGAIARATYERMPLAELERQVRSQPEAEDAAVILARRLLARGEHRRAAEALAASAEQEGASGDLWLLRAEALLGAGDDRAAYGAARLGLRSAARPADGHWVLGEIHLRGGNERSAEAEFGKAAQADPSHVRARLRLAQIALSHGYAGRTLEHLEPAVRAAPKSAEALRLRARALRQLGRLLAAEEATRAAIRLAPNDPGGHFLLGQILRAAPAGAQRAEAEAALRRALQLQPELVLARHELGMLYFESGDLQRALDEFRIVLGQQPLHKPTYLPMLQCAHRLGNTREGARLLREYRRLDEMDLDTAPLEYSLWAMPDNSTLRLKLARLYLKYERPDLARTQVAQALKSRPEDPEALRLRKQLGAAAP